jgi:hypothetical protein
LESTSRTEVVERESDMLQREKAVSSLHDARFGAGPYTSRSVSS